jgi:Glycosyl transferases group 1
MPTAPRTRIAARSEAVASDRGRPCVAVIAWTAVESRAAETAGALGGEARSYYRFRFVPAWAKPVRYVVSAIRTTTYLLARQPKSVIATNPPVFPALIALAYARIARVPMLLDSHPSAFGVADDRVATWLMPVHAWLARHADSTLVASDRLAEIVLTWGGRADIVHEAPPDWTVRRAGPLGRQPRVVFVGVFAADEPFEQMIDAARMLPSVDVQITGDLRACRREIISDAPPNVAFTGFLRSHDYPRLLEGADIVVALTREPPAGTRAAYEAVYAGRPLIVSDFPLFRALFPYAVVVENNPISIARGVEEAIDRHAELVAAAQSAFAIQQSRWEKQLEVLRQRLGLDQQGPARDASAPLSPVVVDDDG